MGKAKDKARDKARRSKLHDDAMGFLWHLQVGGTEASAYAWYAKTWKLPMPDPGILGDNRGSFGTNTAARFTGIIWIGKDSGSGTMAHEVAHAVAHVCRVLEMDPREADEFQASYAGYLMRHLNKLAWRRR